MMRALVLSCLLVAVGGCRASKSECDQLLDHFVDVEGDADVAGHFATMTPQLTAAVAREKKLFRAELAARFSERCQAQLSSAEVRCALRATDEAGLDRCENRR